jgi:hypothetical protein
VNNVEAIQEVLRQINYEVTRLAEEVRILGPPEEEHNDEE